MNKYILVQNIVTQLTEDLTFRTFFTLYLMADSEEEREKLDARFWKDAARLDAGEQQSLREEFTRTFLRLPVLIRQLQERASMTSA